MTGAPIGERQPTRPERCRLPIGELQPLRQGDLDCFCGLYAIINGLRLLFEPDRPLTHREAKRLFNRGIAHLASHSTLTVTALAGLDDEQWLDLMVSILGAAQKVTGREVQAVQPLIGAISPSTADLAATIESAIIAGCSVLAAVTGWRDHYVVISGYTPATYRLHDSGPLYWLTRNNCRLGDEDDEGRHVIKAASLTVLSLA